MHPRVRLYFVWLWMAALLSASVGVSVQKVYCYCLGKTWVSFYLSEEPCHLKERVSNAQAHVFGGKGGNCCAKKKLAANQGCCKKPGADKNGCTKKTTRVFQLKTEFEVGHPEFKKFDFAKHGLLAFAAPVLPPTVPVAQRTGFQAFNRPPPSLSGRTICIRHGVFRC